MSELLQNFKGVTDRVLASQTDQEIGDKPLYPIELDRELARVVNTLQTALLQEISEFLLPTTFIAKLRELLTFPEDYDYVSNIDLLCEVISFAAAVYAILKEQKRPEMAEVSDVLKNLKTLPKQVRETIVRRTRDSQFAAQILEWVK